jgi:hypothetical protein
LFEHDLRANAFRVCREGKPVPTFPDHALRKKGGTVRRDKKLTVPCRCFEILAGKCGFTGQPERRNDGSNPREIGNAIPILT